MASRTVFRRALATLVLAAGACLGACGDSNSDLMAPVAGTGGESQADGSADVSAGGGSSGAGGAVSKGGTAGGGAAGTSNQGGAAGKGGQGGTAGNTSQGGGGGAGKGGQAGSAGSTCGNCNDGVSCTLDLCVGTTCTHTIDAKGCAKGYSCDPKQGCVQNPVCANSDQCAQKYANDPCKTNIACDAALAVCTYSLLDKDSDGQPPVVCGGADCNDANPNVHAGALESCNGADDDCDNVIDNGAACSGLSECLAGTCTCPAEHACGSDCVDKATSNIHCGQCNHPCIGGSSCVSGVCQCPGGTTLCASGCVDLNTDPKNCGACQTQCAQGFSCVNHACTCPKTICSGQCVDPLTDAKHCGTCTTQCPTGATCQSGNCVCNGGLTICDNTCVDTKASLQHCGACHQTCSGSCQAGLCVACVESDLYILLDTTVSMAGSDGGLGRLAHARQGIEDFLNESQSSGMGVGIGYFPITMPNPPSTCSNDTDCGCGGVCSYDWSYYCSTIGDLNGVSDYATPKAPIGLLPGNSQAVVNSWINEYVGGGTPPASLQGALQYATTYAQSHADHKVAVVLIADGMPNECTTHPGLPTDWLPNVTTAASGNPKVLTYVITMDSATQSGFNQIAAAGGTGTARLATTYSAITAALGQIRTEFKTCP